MAQRLTILQSQLLLDVGTNASSSPLPSPPADSLSPAVSDNSTVIEDSLRQRHTTPTGKTMALVSTVRADEDSQHRTRGTSIDRLNGAEENVERYGMNKKRKTSSNASTTGRIPGAEVVSSDLDKSRTLPSDRTVTTVQIRSSPPGSALDHHHSRSALLATDHAFKTSIISFGLNGPKNQGVSGLSSTRKETRSAKKLNTSESAHLSIQSRHRSKQSSARTDFDTSVKLSRQGNVVEQDEDALAGFAAAKDAMFSQGQVPELSLPHLQPTNLGQADVCCAQESLPQILDQQTILTDDTSMSDAAGCTSPLIRKGARTSEKHKARVVAKAIPNTIEETQSINDRSAIKLTTPQHVTLQSARASDRFNSDSLSEPAIVMKSTSRKRSEPAVMANADLKKSPAPFRSCQESTVSTINTTLHVDTLLERRAGWSPHHRSLFDRFLGAADHLVSDLAKHEDMILALIDECWRKHY